MFAEVDISTFYFALSAVIFLIGMAGLLLRRNLIVVFMSLELMMNAVNLNFIGLSRHLDQIDGQVFAIFVIVVAAAEAVTGLAILVALYKQRESLDIDNFNLLKW
jgi:NADH-quinone oxidoreductase subunit K